MQRRRFLQTLAVGGTLGLSGCAGLNPLSSPTPPTEEQLKYIEHYPNHTETTGSARVLVTKQNDMAVLDLVSFGSFDLFELYTVHPNGNGSQIGTITPENIQGEEPEGLKTVPLSNASGGTLLLILGVTPKQKRYTYGAFHYDGSEFKQVAYVESTPTSNNSDS